MGVGWVEWRWSRWWEREVVGYVVRVGGGGLGGEGRWVAGYRLHVLLGYRQQCCLQ